MPPLHCRIPTLRISVTARSLLKFQETVDTILLARKTYELFVDFWPDATADKEVIADRLNEIPKFIVSNTIKKAPWGRWPEAGIINGDVIDAIKKLKSQPGYNIVLWGSIALFYRHRLAKLPAGLKKFRWFG
jgi:dihydrofolate reductase